MCLQLETLQLSWTMQLVNPIEKTGLPLHRQQLPMGYYFIVIMKAFYSRVFVSGSDTSTSRRGIMDQSVTLRMMPVLVPFLMTCFASLETVGKFHGLCKESKQTKKGICRKRFIGLRKQLQIEPFELLLTYLGVHTDILLRAYGYEQYCISHLTQGFSIWGYTEELPEEILKLQVS